MKKLLFTFLACAGFLYAADTVTTRMGLVKPEEHSTGWGDKVRNNYDVIDSSVAILNSTQTFTAPVTFTKPLSASVLTPNQILVATSTYPGSEALAVKGTGKFFDSTGGTLSLCDQNATNCANMSLENANPLKGVVVATVTVTNLRFSDGSVQTSSATGLSSVIQLRETLQSGATFYVSSGTVKTKFNISDTNMGINITPGSGTGGAGNTTMRGGSTFAPITFEQDFYRLKTSPTSRLLWTATETLGGSVSGWNFQSLGSTKTAVGIRSGPNTASDFPHIVLFSTGAIAFNDGLNTTEVVIQSSSTNSTSHTMVLPRSPAVSTGSVLSASSINGNTTQLGWSAAGSGDAILVGTQTWTGTNTFNGLVNVTSGRPGIQGQAFDLAADDNSTTLGRTAGRQNPWSSTSRNTFIGGSSGNAMTGSNNTSVGYFSLLLSTSGERNTGIGAFALESDTVDLTQNDNVGVGYFSGRFNVGDKNTYIGSFSGPASTTTVLSRAVAIGYNAIASSSSVMQLGGTGVDAVTVNGSTLTFSSGTITALNVSTINGAGAVLTSTQTTVTLSSATTSASFVPTNLSNSITPHSASNRVKLTVSCSGSQTVGAGTACFTFTRNGTNLGATNGFQCHQFNVTGTSDRFGISFSHIDEPATASPVSYAVAMMTSAGTATFNDNTTLCVLMFEEKPPF